jgi:hypothetical protein
MSLTPENVVDYLRTQSDDALERYKHYFNGVSDGEDPVFGFIRNQYLNMNQDQRILFIEFLRTIQTDVFGSVFSFLDNQAFPRIQDEEILLSENSRILNGDLTDILFEKEELRGGA